MPAISYREINAQLTNIDQKIAALENVLSSLEQKLTPLQDLNYCRWVLDGAVDLIKSLAQQIKNVQDARSRLNGSKTIQVSQDLQNELLRLENEKSQLSVTIQNDKNQLMACSAYAGWNQGGNEQADSIIKSLNQAEKQLDSCSQKIDNCCRKLDGVSDDPDIDQKIQVIIEQLDKTKQDSEALSSLIDQANILHKLAKQENLFGATVRGNVKKIAHFLAQDNGNGDLNKTYENKKPIHYAIVCGHLDVFVILLDCTTLSNLEISSLQDELSRLQKIDKSTQSIFIKMKDMLDNLPYAKTYDHLWKQEHSDIKRLQLVFRDYYSPILFRFQKILPDAVNRILMFAWNRTRATLGLAEIFYATLQNFVTNRTQVDKSKIEEKILTMYSDFATFVTQKQANKHGTFARRINYCSYRLGIKLPPIEEITVMDSKNNFNSVNMSSVVTPSSFFKHNRLSVSDSENNDENSKKDQINYQPRRL